MSDIIHKEDEENLYYSDLEDSSSLGNLINNINPMNHNLAAQSTAVSFKNPMYTLQLKQWNFSNSENLRNLNKNVKFYHTSSEMFEEKMRFY